MKVQWCDINKNKFCQEDDCNNCETKRLHTCEDCGFVGMSVNAYDYQGDTWIVCDSFKDCVARGSRQIVEENKAKAGM
jgi:hypothetical protein